MEPTTSLIFVAHPEKGKPKEKFGMNLATIKRESDMMHVCMNVEAGGLADQFKLREKDELLMVNSNGVIDETHEKVLEMFASLKTTESITIIIRRHTREDDNEKVEYIWTIGEIMISEDKESVRRLLVVITYTLSSPNGVIYRSTENVHIKCISPEGFLKYDGKRLLFKKDQAFSDDDAYKFKILYCNNIRNGQNDLVNIIKAYTKNFFLTVNIDDNTVTMEEREVDEDGVPLKYDRVLLTPKSSKYRQQYQVYGDKKKYLAWDMDEGIRVETVESDPNGKAKFIFFLDDFKE